MPGLNPARCHDRSVHRELPQKEGSVDHERRCDYLERRRKNFSLATMFMEHERGLKTVYFLRRAACQSWV